MDESKQLEAMDFDDLKPIEVSVKVKGKRYVLRQASAEAKAQFDNAKLRATKLEDGKLVSLAGMADVEPLLVSLCLFNADTDGRLPLTADGDPDLTKLVPLKTVKLWDARIVADLFDRSKAISGLVDKETIESVTKQIDDLMKRRQKLLDAKAHEGNEKTDPNVTLATTAGSA